VPLKVLFFNRIPGAVMVRFPLKVAAIMLTTAVPVNVSVCAVLPFWVKFLSVRKSAENPDEPMEMVLPVAKVALPPPLAKLIPPLEVLFRMTLPLKSVAPLEAMCISRLLSW
jgi:hypothetical protein